jgi:site-specific recombinase XerD
MESKTMAAAGGATTVRPSMDYGDWVLNWWWPAAIQALSENTRSNYRTTLNIYVLPYFESTPLDQITKGAIRHWVEKLQGLDIKPSTIESAIRVFRTTMMAAMARELIPVNPLVGVRSS